MALTGARSPEQPSVHYSLSSPPVVLFLKESLVGKVMISQQACLYYLVVSQCVWSSCFGKRLFLKPVISILQALYYLKDQHG